MAETVAKTVAETVAETGSGSGLGHGFGYEYGCGLGSPSTPAFWSAFGDPASPEQHGRLGG